MEEWLEGRGNSHTSRIAGEQHGVSESGKAVAILKEPDLFCTLTCDDVRREANGKGMLIGIFSNLNSIAFPFAAEFHVFSGWSNGIGAYEHQTLILDPDESLLFEGEPIPFTLREEHQRHYVNERLRIEFARPGRHFVTILLGGQPRLTLSLDVREVEKAP